MYSVQFKAKENKKKEKTERDKPKSTHYTVLTAFCRPMNLILHCAGPIGPMVSHWRCHIFICKINKDVPTVIFLHCVVVALMIAALVGS